MKKITDEPITYKILEDMGFKYEGSMNDDEATEYSKEELYLIECYDRLSNSFCWVDDETGKIFKTINDLLD